MTILQFIAGAILLCFLVWLKTRHVEKAVQIGAPDLPKLNAWTKILAHIVLGLVAAACLLDPLIPGVANLTIKHSTAPSSIPTLPQHLRVRVVPVGFLGQAGGDRTVDVPFDSDGSAQVLSDLALLETRVTVQIYDETQPSKMIESATVYISPFVRRQLVSKTITF